MSNAHVLSNHQDNNEVQTINPATGKTIRNWPLQSKAEGEAIVDQAHEAFLAWRTTDMETRAKIIQKIASLLDKNKDDLAKLMAEEMGKPVKQGLGEIERCIRICKYTAEDDYKNLSDEERPLKDGKKGIITYQPLGVILGIQPWNFPLYQVIRYSVPNLMAGNAVLLTLPVRFNIKPLNDVVLDLWLGSNGIQERLA